MERRNAKQLRLSKEMGEAAEKMHREYQVATSQHNLSFVDFGNLVLEKGLIATQMLMNNNKSTKRKIRRRKP